MMKREVRERLLALNLAFYDAFAAPFAASRRRLQPGIFRLERYVPQPCASLLDVGAGHGELGRRWLAEGLIGAYTAVDFSAGQMAAIGDMPGTFVSRDVARPGALDDLGQHTAVVCLATLHHIPGRAQRAALVQALADRLAPAGRLMLSTWQFLDSPRQRRKIAPWSTVGLTAEDLEAGDYLVRWRRGGEGVRYIAAVDPAETARLAAAAGLTLMTDFRSDGREGDLGYYSVWERRVAGS